MTSRALGIGSALLMLGGPAFAHHSFAMFDYNKDVTITGEVKELQWVNPHIHLLVNAPDAKGVMAEWDVEGGTPGNLRRQGWARDVVKPGDKISVVIRPLKNGDNGGQLISAKKGDGTAIGGQGGGGE
jgi:uncharacterized protein DUF6152